MKLLQIRDNLEKQGYYDPYWIYRAIYEMKKDSEDD